MDFRWVAFIAIWTLVSGPILGTPSGPVSGARSVQVKVEAVKKAQPLLKNAR